MYNARAGVAALAVAVVAATATSATAAGPQTAVAHDGSHRAAAATTTPSWHRIASSWPRRKPVTVTDVTSVGRHAWVAANSGTGRRVVPMVQSCTTRSCKAIRLPRPHRQPSAVTSISADGNGGLWAAGFRVRSNGKQRPVWWRFFGGRWQVFPVTLDGIADSESLRITDLEVANPTKAYAIGRYDYGDGVTSTFYRWNGGSWKELAPPHSTDFPTICQGWFHRHWNVLAVRSGAAVLTGKCGPKRTIIEDGPTAWIRARGQNAPTAVGWTSGNYIGQQLWLVGSKSGSRRIASRDGTRWAAEPVSGIGRKSHVTAIAGVNANKVWLVGWVPTGHHHFIASSWRFGAGSWHPTKVPAGVSRSRLVAVSMDSSVANSPAFAVGNDLAASASDRAIIVHTVG